MEVIIAKLELAVHYCAELGIVLVELAGIMVLILSAVQGVVNYFRHNELIRLRLAQGIALALEFKLGGEVLRTVIVREWTEMAVLGAVILLRALLTLLLHWEIRIEEEHEQRHNLEPRAALFARGKQEKSKT
ncbi:MAG: DUF1622 domain-containing protein [Clostridia bacterium]|nr:DUF1622 domain-containing protein [Clostridia bacterium]